MTKRFSETCLAHQDSAVASDMLDSKLAVLFFLDQTSPDVNV